ncbi:hypothetical protein [Pediococcus pentosaceus]|jgi:hypothetical protein|nr:hypothetical protein [Pediococcus pentosaceus]
MAIKLSVTLDLQYFKQGCFFKGSGQTKKDTDINIGIFFQFFPEN